MAINLRDPAALYRAFDTDATPVVDFLGWLAERHHLPATVAMLDVGCGPGRLLAPLRARGWQVVGLEPDAAYRSQAAAIAAQTDAVVRAGGFNDVEGRGEFDLIAGINSSFAHVLTPAARADALQRCAQALRPGGILILDLPNTLRILFEYRPPGPRVVETEGHRLQLSRRHSMDYHAATFTTHETYLVVAPTGEEWTARRDHVYAITSWPDLEYLLRRAGFGVIDLFASLEDRQPSRVAGSRLIIVAQVT